MPAKSMRLRCRNRSLTWLIPVVFVISSAGCGDDEPDAGSAAADRATTSTAAERTTAATTDVAGSGPAEIRIAASAPGQIVVDGDGTTLYLFTPDADGRSTCLDACADAWPPLVTRGAPIAGPGIDAGMVDTHERPDGTRQVTYGGHPLYRFTEDTAPGDTFGQANGAVWFVVGADGRAVETPTGDDGGY